MSFFEVVNIMRFTNMSNAAMRHIVQTTFLTDHTKTDVSEYI